MSAIGTKRTSACALRMSAFDPKRTLATSFYPSPPHQEPLQVGPCYAEIKGEQDE